LLTFSFNAYSDKNEKKKRQRRPAKASDYIDKREIQKERKLLRLIDAEILSIMSVKKRREQLSYRFFELHFEKLKVVRKRETRKLIAKKKKRLKNKQSSKIYKKATLLGKNFIKKFPKSRYLSNVYNAMASMIIEVRNTPEKDKKIILSHLEKAIKFSRNTKQQYITKSKLAEFYYTLQDWGKAIEFYQQVVKYKKDSWHTKNLFNYAWCLFQTKKYNEATIYLKQAYRFSFSKKYVDYREQVSDAINYFYVFNKEPRKAVDFHFKNKESVLSEQFSRILKITKKHMSLRDSISLEQYARKFCELRKDYLCQLNLSYFRVETAREVKDYDMHFKYALKVKKEYEQIDAKILEENATTVELIIDNIRSLTTYIQQMAYKGHYRILKGQEKTYKRVISYYWILKKIDKKKRFEYSYLQAELSFKEKRFPEASQYYKESLSYIDKKEVKDEKYIDKVLDSMIALANEERFKDDKYFELAHSKFIEYRPRSVRSPKIYQNLFKFYIAKKGIKSAEGLVENYHKNIRKDLKLQKEMYKEVLNYYISNKDMVKLAKQVRKLKKGFLSYSKGFIEKNVIILGELLFTQAQEYEKQGKHEIAITEYEKLYENENYPQKIKLESALNMAIAYLKLGDVSSSYKWAKTSFKFQKNKYFKEKVPVYLQLAEKYFLSQDLKNSRRLYSRVFPKLCPLVRDIKLLSGHYYKYQNLLIIDRRYKRSQRLGLSESKCRVPQNISKDVARLYIDKLISEKDVKRLSETKGQIKFNQYQKEVFEFMLNKLWLEPITLAELKDNNIYGRLTAFLDNNVMISRKDKKEVDYYYQFLEYMSQVQQQDYTVAMPNPFNIDQLIKNIENKTNQYVQFKQKGETLAQLTKFPAAYVSILSAQVFNDMRFEQGISGLDYTAAITDMNIKKQMDANIKSILDGIQANKDNLKKMVADTVRKNQVISVHTKFSHFDQELFDTSLYQKEDLSLIYVGK
jgi:hypothetical protein